ncbi:MAG: hypothetical protein ACTSPI_01170 [Candidatus Heimdallarchaeaceae archaeon]
MKKIFIGLIILMGFIGLVLASDFTPQGDINLRGVYSIKNATTINATGNITTGGYFVGNGTSLNVNASELWITSTGIMDNLADILGSAITNSYSWINQTIADVRYILQSSEGDLNVNSSDYWDGLGSPTDLANKTLLSQANITDEDWIEDSQESSLNVNASDFWDSLNTVADILGSLINNDLSWLNLTQIRDSFYNKTESDVKYYNSSNPFGYFNETTNPDTDTNASTACTGTEVLLGNGTCIDGSYFDTDTNISDTNETPRVSALYSFNYYNSTDFSISDYLTSVEILAFGYYNATDFVITDYFTKTQILNFEYYNSTDFNISDYFTSSEILAFDYYNSTDFNISDYFTSAEVLGFSYYNSTDFSISDYYTKTQINDFNFYNATDFSISDYYLINNPFSFYNSTSIPSYILSSNEGNLDVNRSDFWDDIDSPLATWVAVFNQTYHNAWLYVTNSTFALISEPLWSSNYTAYNDSWSYYEPDTNISDTNETDRVNVLYGNPFGWYNLTDFDYNDYSTTTEASALYVNLTGDDMTGNLTNTKWFKGKFNWTTADDWNFFNGSSLDFNESKLAAKYYNASQADVIAGTIDGGSIEDTQHDDGGYDDVTLNFSEASGAPGLDLRINFTNVNDLNGGIMRYKTSSLSGNWPIIQLWNYNTNSWQEYPPIAETDVFLFISDPVYNSRFIDGGIVQMRIYKAANGNTQNHYYVDWIAVFEGYGTPIGYEVDPFSFHRNKNLNNSGYNITADYFFGNGSQLTGIITNDTNETTRVNAIVGTNCTGTDKYSGIFSNGTLICTEDSGVGGEVDPIWTANFTAYNDSWSYYEPDTNISDTDTNASTACSGTEVFLGNGSCIEGSYFDTDTNISDTNETVRVSALYGFGYYNSTDFDYNTFYLKANPFGFYNATDFSISDYYTNANPFGFYNSTNPQTETDPNWAGNYSTFLTHITWANVINGTMAKMADVIGFEYYNSTDFSISDYFTKTQVLDFSYYNSTDFDINDYYGVGNAFGFYNSTTLVETDPISATFGYYNSTNLDISSDTSPQLGGYLDTNGENIGSTTDEIENIYMTTNNKLYVGTAQEGEIFYNDTCVLIVGPTSQLEIC